VLSTAVYFNSQGRYEQRQLYHPALKPNGREIPGVTGKLSLAELYSPHRAC